MKKPKSKASGTTPPIKPPTAIGTDGQPGPEDGDPQSTLDMILKGAFQESCWDISIIEDEQETRIVFTINGEINERNPIEKGKVAPLVDYLKSISDQRALTAKTGSFNIKLGRDDVQASFSVDQAGKACRICVHR